MIPLSETFQKPMPLQKRSALVCDRERTVQVLVRMFLGAHGTVLHDCDSFEVAERLLDDKAFDFAILDTDDFIETSADLKEKVFAQIVERSIPVILLVRDRTDCSAILKSLSTKIETLKKPFNGQELIAAATRFFT